MKLRSDIERKRLLEVISKFENTPILVQGDVILDRYVWGKVERISPEAPVVVVQVTKDDQRLGGAANVVKNLCCLGAKVSLCGILGEDEAGRGVKALLDEDGVEHGGLIQDSESQTTIKTRVIAHHQQVVRIDRERIQKLQPDASSRLAKEFAKRIPEHKAVIISDYGKGAVCPSIFGEIAKGYSEGILGAKKIPVIVDPKAPHFDLYTHATVIKPNRKEAEEASGLAIPNRAAAVRAAQVLLERWKSEMVMITLGEEGMVLVSNIPMEEPVLEVDTEAREVFDVSGAGDTVSAVFALALGVGASQREAAVLSNISAGIVVAEVGTVPIRIDQLRRALEES